MRITKDFKCNIFGINFRLILDENLLFVREMVNRITRGNGILEIPDDNPAGCVFTMPEFNATIIYLNKKRNENKIDIDTVTHEVFHAVSRTLQSKGIKLCDNTEEVYAHYTGWLNKKVFDFLNSLKK